MCQEKDFFDAMHPCREVTRGKRGAGEDLPVFETEIKAPLIFSTKRPSELGVTTTHNSLEQTEENSVLFSDWSGHTHTCLFLLTFLPFAHLTFIVTAVIAI